MSSLKNLQTLDELNEIVDKNTFIIYDAGKVTTVLLNYLSGVNLLDKVFCIAVTRVHGNPDEIRGIPVCVIDDLLEYTKKADILIAAMEKSQPSIALELKRRGFEHICGMGNLLYSKLRRMETSYESDILQTVVALQNSQKVMFKMIQRLENIILYEGRNSCNNKDLYLNMYGYELKEWYWRNTGKVLRLDYPRSFNEKIQWLKLCDSTAIKTDLADKYKVREYVREKIGEQYLIPLCGVWDDFTQIDFSELPDQFVLKCNHGSGWNCIVRDKSKINYKKMCKQFNGWLKSNYAYNAGFELQYKNIRSCIIAEEYISELNGEVYDYRFFCFDGKPLYVWVDKGSGTSDHQRNIYNIEWEKQNYRVNYPDISPNPPKPNNYEEMVECAKKLSEGFIFVRVDLYSVDEKVYFGEMTFTPQSGIGDWDNEEINLYYGSLIKLPIEDDETPCEKAENN